MRTPENELFVLEKLSFEQLIDYIRDLADKDFLKLIHLLYRLDVSEAKIKLALENTGDDGDVGFHIAHLVMERLEQSHTSRQQYKKQSDIPENEKW